jgi:2,3-bisphosphoglycerate-independent phosphoglycerate mutase
MGYRVTTDICEQPQVLASMEVSWEGVIDFRANRISQGHEARSFITCTQSSLIKNREVRNCTEYEYRSGMQVPGREWQYRRPENLMGKS